MGNDAGNWAAFFGGLNNAILDGIQYSRQQKEHAQRMEEQLKYEERRMLMEQNTRNEIDKAKGAAAELAYDDVVSAYGGAVKKTAKFAESLSSMTPGLPAMGGGMSPFPMPRRGQTGTYMEAFDDARKAIYPSQADIQRNQLEAQKQRGRTELQELKGKQKRQTTIDKSKNIKLTDAQEKNLYEKETTSIYETLAESPVFVTKAPVLLAHKSTLDFIAKGILDKMSKGQFGKGTGKTAITPFEQFAQASIEAGFPSDDSSLEFLNAVWQKYIQAHARSKQGK